MTEQQPFQPKKHEEGQWPMPQIFVTSVPEFDGGRIHGAWLEAGHEPEFLQRGIDNMLARSPDPASKQWALYDYVGFGTLSLWGTQDIEYISRLGKGLLKHGPAFAALAELVGDDDLLDSFEHCYKGHWKSVEQFAKELTDAIGIRDYINAVVDPFLHPYLKIDYETLARNMEATGQLIAVNDGTGGIYLFIPG